MRVYLAGDSYLKQTLERLGDNKVSELFLLRTFVSNEPWFERYYNICKDVILDSGAFSFMSGKDVSRINWEEYVERYAHFVLKNNIKHFIELDIDAIVGFEEVKRLRKKLEQLTNKQPIPVWHKSRGKEAYLQDVANYDYIALGGFAIKNWKRKDYKFIEWFIKEAHKNNTKIHGLGFTNFSMLETLKFDSVDSSSWTVGSRYGSISKFDGRKVVNISKKPGTKCVNQSELAFHNFTEWTKFQQWALFNL